MKEMVGGCCVCGDERGWTENPLVYCDGHSCNVAVHQACYGIVSVPTGPWFCRKCESQERAARVKCELCPQREGALKRTDNGGWAHVVCALYIPEVCFGNVSTMEPILLAMIPHERYNKSCFLCESKGRQSKATTGCCMTCNRNGCRTSFHVTCAQQEGLLCEEAGQHNDNVKYTGYCNYHYQKLKKDKDIKTIPPFRPFGSNYSTPEKEKPMTDRPSDKTKADLKERHRAKSEKKTKSFEVSPVYGTKDSSDGGTTTSGASSTSGHSAKFTNANFTETTIVPSTAISEEASSVPSGDSSLILKFRRNTVTPANGKEKGKKGSGGKSESEQGEGAEVEEVNGDKMDSTSATEERTQSPALSVESASAGSKSGKTRRSLSREPSRTPTPSSVSTTPMVITETVMVKDLPPMTEPEATPADTDSATPVSNSSTSGAPGSTPVDVEKVSSPSTSPPIDVKLVEVKKPVEDRKDKETILGSGSEKHEKKKHRRQSKEGKASRSRRDRDHGGDDDYGGKKRRRTSNPLVASPLTREDTLFTFGQRGVLSQGSSLSLGDGVGNTNSSSTNPDELAIHDVFSTAGQSGLLIGPPRSGSNRQSQHGAPGPIMPATMEQLLERQWDQSSDFLMQQSSHLDIASLLSCLHQLRQENLRLEQHISSLLQRRDHLLAVNARLSLPLTQVASSNNPNPNATGSLLAGAGGGGGGGVAVPQGTGVGPAGDNSPGSAGSGSTSRSPRFNNILHNAQGQDLMSSYSSSHSLNQSLNHSLNQSPLGLSSSSAHPPPLNQSPASSLTQSHPLHPTLTNHISSQLGSTPVSLNHSSTGVSLALTTTTVTTATSSAAIGLAHSSGMFVGRGGHRLPGVIPPGHPMTSEPSLLSSAGQQFPPGHGMRASPGAHLMAVNHNRASPASGGGGRTTPSRGQGHAPGAGSGGNSSSKLTSGGGQGRSGGMVGTRSSPSMVAGPGLPTAGGSITAGTPSSRTDGAGDGLSRDPKQSGGPKDISPSVMTVSLSSSHGMPMYQTHPSQHQHQHQQQHVGPQNRHLTAEQQQLIYQMMHSSSKSKHHHHHHQGGGGERGGGSSSSQRHQTNPSAPPPSSTASSSGPPNGDMARRQSPPPSKAPGGRSDRRPGGSAKDKT